MVEEELEAELDGLGLVDLLEDEMPDRDPVVPFVDPVF
jgi:hypothetical protein